MKKYTHFTIIPQLKSLSKYEIAIIDSIILQEKFQLKLK